MKDISNVQPKYPLIHFKLITSFSVPPGHRAQPVYVFSACCYVSALCFAACLCFSAALTPSSAESEHFPLKVLRAPEELGFPPGAPGVDVGLCVALVAVCCTGLPGNGSEMPEAHLCYTKQWLDGQKKKAALPFLANATKSCRQLDSFLGTKGWVCFCVCLGEKSQVKYVVVSSIDF